MIFVCYIFVFFFFFKQKTAYEMRISDWSSDVCSSDLFVIEERHARLQPPGHGHAVDPLHRVVDQHHGGIEAQRLVDGLAGTGQTEMPGNEGGDRKSVV